MPAMCMYKVRPPRTARAIRKSTNALPMAASAGGLVLELQTPDELVGSFRASFGEVDNHIEGCFHAFATEVRHREL